MLLLITILLVLSIALNIVFYVKLNNSHKVIEHLLNNTNEKNETVWANFEKIIK